MTAVEYVREICKQKNIPISKLESECKFGNGYLNPKKQSKIDPDRAAAISAYLKIPVEEILSRNMSSSELLCNAQAFLKKDNREMMDLLIAEGANISGPEDFQMLRDGIREVDGFREMVRHICEKNGLSDILMSRLGFNKKAPTQAGKREVSDDDIKFALFGGDGEITDAMFDEVKRFAKMVKLREEAEQKE